MNRPRALRTARLAASMLLVGGLLTACDEGNGFPVTCDRPDNEEATAYQGGGFNNGGVYMTTEWDGDLLYYPGGAHYRIYHQLGKIPDWFIFYVSFERDGVNSGSVAQAAGNQVEVKEITDEYIRIVNGTCTQYWLLGRVGEQD